MRTKFKDLGIGNKINIYGQYVRVGSNNTVLLCNIYNKDTGEYLCDHIWVDKGIIPFNKEHDDFVVISGIIYEYQKYFNQTDYNIKPMKCYLIKPFVYRSNIVFMISSERCNSNYWFYTHRRGFDECDVYVDFTTNNILHLFDGNEEIIGYEVLLEGNDYYDLYYKKEDSRIRVYKFFDSALKSINFSDISGIEN